MNISGANLRKKMKAALWLVYSEKGMYVGLKQPLGDGERCVTPARAAAKETKSLLHINSFVVTFSFN